MIEAVDSIKAVIFVVGVHHLARFTHE